MLPRVMPGMQYCAGRGPDLAAAHDEEMRRVAGGDEAMRIEHQRFVGSGIGRLDAGGDAVELGVRVELLVLHVGIAAPHMDRVEAKAPLAQFRDSALLYSGMMTMVAGEIVTRGS